MIIRSGGSDRDDACNGMCMFGSDIGVPEAGDVVAYAHPECPAHGDPLDYDQAAETCGGGDETLRYVREEDMEATHG